MSCNWDVKEGWERNIMFPVNYRPMLWLRWNRRVVKSCQLLFLMETENNKKQKVSKLNYFQKILKFCHLAPLLGCDGRWEISRQLFIHLLENSRCTISKGYQNRSDPPLSYHQIKKRTGKMKSVLFLLGNHDNFDLNYDDIQFTLAISELCYFSEWSS